MGSREEFRQMVRFVRENRIYPSVSRVVKGIDNLQAIDDLFTEMKQGTQFGKLVVQMVESGNADSALSGGHDGVKL